MQSLTNGIAERRNHNTSESLLSAQSNDIATSYNYQNALIKSASHILQALTIMVDDNFENPLRTQLIKLIKKHGGQFMEYHDINLSWQTITLAIIDKKSHDMKQYPEFRQEVTQYNIPTVQSTWIYASIMNEQIEKYEKYKITILPRKRRREFVSTDEYSADLKQDTEPPTKKTKVDPTIMKRKSILLNRRRVRANPEVIRRRREKQLKRKRMKEQQEKQSKIYSMFCCQIH